ncbi:hypothetical protein HMPREF0239_04031 [Clostridium sp. ATCC BAA-442]|uniref:Uncharacterized protein n=1 Tax=Flavonifractor plautii ATCC 29863 TaxID=411475 RepID=G9YWK5_FLAPL|nr:hypothetical protein HMPREF0372_03921 [Flavonifractor plautii ATCC 29863]ERI67332.1 hypothetical protein HMPREF0239_04031 [Clostridium sp. ATCC BAA-442]
MQFRHYARLKAILLCNMTGSFGIQRKLPMSEEPYGRSNMGSSCL